MLRNFGLRGLQITAGAVMLVALMALSSSPSRAFVRNHTDNPTPGAGPALFWNAGTMPVKFQINPTPPTGIAAAAAWQAGIKRGLHNWIVLPTSDLTASFVGTTASTAYVSGDANTIFALNTGWDGGSMVLALTRVDFVLATGQLTDADMKLNGEQFTWTDSYTAERATTGFDTDFDLESVTTHEFGHAWGFGHSLDSTGVSPGDPDYDDNGTPGVFTDDQINGPNQNTMDPVTVAGETYQRSIATDDSAAMDSAYGSASTTLTRPSVFVTEPDGAGDAPAGNSFTIQWLSQYEGPSNPTVAFYYTTDPSATAVASLTGATLIAANIASPKTGVSTNYTWNFLNVPAGNYYVIAVVTADGKTEKDVSAGPVTVAASTLTLNTPTLAGITINPFDTYAITWTVGGSSLGNVKIDLSLDNGVTYLYPVAKSAPNTGTYSFTAPNPQTGFGSPGPLTNCKIRVAYVANAAISAQSSNPFTLAANTNSLVLNSPVGGEVLTSGQTLNISFNAAGTDVGDDFAIFWTDDNGASWAPVNNAVHITGPNPRIYSWVVPAQVGAYNKIQIFSLTATQYYSVSPSPFTILQPGTKTISTYPDHLVFDVVVGGGNPATVPLYFRNAGVGLLTNSTVTVTGDTSVTVTPNSFITVGPAPDLATLTVGVTNGYGAAGSSNASLVFTTPAGTATNEGYSVPVTIRIHAAGGILPLTYTPSTLTFIGDPGALPPGAQSSLIVNPNANVDTTVDAFTDSFNVLVKPGRFSLTAGDAVAGGTDEQNLAVIADTTALPPGTNGVAHIFTQATNLGTGFITVNVKTSGTAPGTSSKKSGCALLPQVNGAGSAGNTGAAALEGLELLLVALSCALWQRRKRAEA